MLNRLIDTMNYGYVSLLLMVQKIQIVRKWELL